MHDLAQTDKVGWRGQREAGRLLTDKMQLGGDEQGTGPRKGHNSVPKYDLSTMLKQQLNE